MMLVRVTCWPPKVRKLSWRDLEINTRPQARPSASGDRSPAREARRSDNRCARPPVNETVKPLADVLSIKSGFAPARWASECRLFGSGVLATGIGIDRLVRSDENRQCSPHPGDRFNQHACQPPGAFHGCSFSQW